LFSPCKSLCSEFLKSAGPHLVVADFSAKWCGPCKMIRPFVHGLAVRYENVLFCNVDVDLAGDVADLCHIVSMPTFQFFMRGEKVSVAKKYSLVLL
uniref:Thioredoxin domain-containing protein n=1 Tax=Varanus komodoensis TaxID=61221 RepID=A0A8D2KZ95_VARKO